MPHTARYHWHTPTDQRKAVQVIRQKLGVSELLATVMANRGLNPVTAAAFLSGATSRAPHELPGVDRMNAQLRRLIRLNRPILVYGDASLDGICATTIITSAIRQADGMARFYLPDVPAESYGLHRATVERAVAKGFHHFVVLDTAHVPRDVAEFVHQHGGEILILDHHISLLPPHPAVTIVNPVSPANPYVFAGLSSSAIAYKVAQMLVGPELAEEYTELIALATLGDDVPLVDENRAFLKRGLNHLARTRNPGLMKIKEQMGLEAGGVVTVMEARRIGWWINDLAKHAGARTAVKLLITRDLAEAAELAVKAELASQTLFQGAYDRYDEAAELIYNMARAECREAIVLYRPADPTAGWHPGMVDHLARVLAERQGKPALVLIGSGEFILGAAVNTEERDLHDVLRAMPDRFRSMSVHGGVLWITMATDDIAGLAQEINTRLKRLCPSGFGRQGCETKETIAVDAWVSPYQITPNAVKELSSLEPFGPGNPPPLLGIRQVQARRRYFQPPPTPIMRVYLHDQMTGGKIAAHWPKIMNAEVPPDHGAYVTVVGSPFLYDRNSKDVLRFQVKDWERLAVQEAVQPQFAFAIS